MNQLLNLSSLLQPSHQNSSSIHCKRYCRHLNQPNQTKRSNPSSINTMGGTKGIGRELLDQLIQSIQPPKFFSFSKDDLRWLTTLGPSSNNFNAGESANLATGAKPKVLKLAHRQSVSTALDIVGGPPKSDDLSI
ncbi:hypothetical protein O181_053115 [Austropuccinia psidii MF-1]|uniref:Uncharacterized protein n=1 Tax=Austropuccinia psidii MF-1 TaxID=1389203 RepID=A0A9Q3HT91_9BASI|nr:hypothetical protein [Austropuccinia psidii MF-1]